ncbi:transposase, partial [Klebsiella pneumoniae]|nr:transposase [Klebsiella pneumoniae]MCT8026921.1 transposase [Klebsiella pneumoniae]MCT8037769.1 transposase [Klebsiella pneumoniae]MCT8049118.1 transposase [Klebsiella pneumoniae]MCT8076932.1 transposase [Klebsiella pneumoniae]
RNRSHWSTSKTPSYTKSVSWQHHRHFPKASRRWWFLCDTGQERQAS